MTVFGNACFLRACGHALSAYRRADDRAHLWFAAFYWTPVRRADRFVQEAIDRAFDLDTGSLGLYGWARDVDLLDVVLTHVREHAIEKATAIECARGLATALNQAYECVCALSPSYAAGGFGSSGAGDAVLMLNMALIDARDHAYSLGLVGTAADLCKAHDYLRAYVVEDVVNYLDRDIARLADEATAVAAALQKALTGEELEVESGFASRPVAPNTTARWLVASATWLLPAGHRDLKAEEFAAELYDVAALGGSARGQVAYALRLLVLSLSLRRSLAGVTEEERQR